MPATKRSKPNGKKKSPSRATSGMEIVIRKLDAMQGQINTMQSQINTMHRDFQGQLKTMHRGFQGQLQTMHRSIQGQFKAMRQDFQGQLKAMRRDFQGQLKVMRRDFQRQLKATRRDFRDRFRSHDKKFDQIYKLLRRHDQRFDEHYQLLLIHGRDIEAVRKAIAETGILLMTHANEVEARDAKFRDSMLTTADAMRKDYDDFSLEKLAQGAQQNRLEGKVDGVQGEVKKLKEANTKKDGAIKDLNLRVTNLEKTKQMKEHAPGEFEQPPAGQ